MWVLNLWEILKNIEYLEKATQILGLGEIWILFSLKAKKSYESDVPRYLLN